MAFRPKKDFAFSTVAIAPSPATSGTTLTLATGTGGRFVNGGPQKLVVWPADGGETPGDFEVISATRSGDVLTIVRAQDGSPARQIRVGDNIAQNVLASDLVDIETVVNGLTSGLAAVSASVAALAESVTVLQEWLEDFKNRPLDYITLRSASSGNLRRMALIEVSGEPTWRYGEVLAPSSSLAWASDNGVTGNPVSAWASSDGETTLGQNVSGNRPGVAANAFGSTAGLQFDGVNDLLATLEKVVAETAAGSVALVFKTGATLGAAMVLVSQSDAAVANDWVEIGIGADGRVYIESNAAGTKHTVRGSTVLDASTVYDLYVMYDGTDYHLRLNGVEENPLTIVNTGAYAWFGRVAGTTTFAVGGTVTSGGTVRPFSGIIGAIEFFATDITS